MDKSIKLRSRLLPSGKRTLYLDTYIHGQRKVEHLHLFLLPPNNPKNKLENKNTLKLANAILHERLADIESGKYSFSKRSELLISYFVNFNKTLEATIFNSLCKFDHNFESKKIDELNLNYLSSYVRYLDGNQNKNSTINLYLVVIRAWLNRAKKRGFIPQNFSVIFPKVKVEPSVKEYLTIDELRIFRNVQIPSKMEDTRNAFVFSCLTGLRYSDVSELTWDNIIDGEDCHIEVRQQKTGDLLYQYLNPDARELLGERGEGNIFNIKSTNWRYLNAICKEAGINKHITFHCARHTFATLLLTYGVDIYTVSKLLGHHSVSTTQIYAKIIDKKKKEAVFSIPKI